MERRQTKVTSTGSQEKRRRENHAKDWENWKHKRRNERTEEHCKNEKEEQKEEQKVPIVTPKINLFKQVPDYLVRIVKDRNNKFLIYDDNSRQDTNLDKLDDEIEKLSNLITSLSVPIAEESVEKSSLKTDLSLEYHKNHFY